MKCEQHQKEFVEGESVCAGCHAEAVAGQVKVAKIAADKREYMRKYMAKYRAKLKGQKPPRRKSLVVVPGEVTEPVTATEPITETV